MLGPYGPLACLCLPIQQVNNYQVRHMIYLQNVANGTPGGKEIRQDLHHRVEAIGGRLSQSGKETALHQVDVDPDGEKKVHETHPSVQVDPD